MAKRLKHDIYRALGEYVINRNSRLLNEEQLKVAKEYKPILMKMYSKVSKEKRNVKLKISLNRYLSIFCLSFIH
ncbi:DUF7821 domain-containing protein [Staphylococcus aureus]|uniref:DUF7821 domain-containing protein n=1 Tax=Staphylococcus aureus TaxID=1280 RepID=UPI0026DFD750|nr:hypothetical protein [Staphylococcus aureus]